MVRLITTLLALLAILCQPYTLFAESITAQKLFGSKDPVVERQLRTMSLSDKIGQMIIAHCPAKYRSSDDTNYQKLSVLISQGKVGGIMFLKGNTYDAAILTNRFQLLAPHPLLISADMEKGLAMRIDGATEFAPSMALSAIGDRNLVYSMAEAIAGEAKALGIYQSYGPSTDLNLNPDNPIINTRSYGDNVEKTISMANAFIDGLQDNGIIATVKHFPGHGDVTVDSHVALPILDGDKKRLDSFELRPFKAAIDHGVLSVMIGHLAVPKITGNLTPATLSWRIVTHLLRKELDFKGLIITDALNMKALYQDHTLEEISTLAVEAGNDLLLFSPDPELTHRTILNAVQEGRISKKRINDSVRRILTAKRWLGLDRQRIINLDSIPEKIGIESHHVLARTIAERSLTIVRDNERNLPLAEGRKKNILHIILENKQHSTSGEEFEKKMMHAFHAKTIRIDPQANSLDYRNARDRAARASAVVLTTYVEVLTGSKNLKLNDMQKSFVSSLVSALPSSTPLVMVSFGTPYIIRNFPTIPTYLCTYTSSPLSEDAVINALKGKFKPEGRLPISLSASVE
ncbi:MAG: glycoside hydrolase family 3 protein [Prosthecochloris sp.]|uniref:beta-N-acetylhexosaminidase n=1 Tax=Prosthecochloris aestuarii (strain DSM 271 / SK 413) TaxID=290512 RepID=B4S3N2_PROA2|nr:MULTISPECIES: glycoside hydrolase family 3 N-terminal domain-containing protein [Prosthecochloris]ACF45228.1 glycoside hydrolase family 3 domain protein [Prosthecochloris aestuarii DSM 271]MCW8797747.1 glycoside hydrolase family 3 protein [Prosthecochloris sp.]NEX12556.1 glycoside hydrolase family 3 [Prosthecochloris sp.]